MIQKQLFQPCEVCVCVTATVVSLFDAHHHCLPQAPTTTEQCMKLWTSAGSCCESSPKRCWRGFLRAPWPSFTPGSPPPVTEALLSQPHPPPLSPVDLACRPPHPTALDLGRALRLVIDEPRPIRKPLLLLFFDVPPTSKSPPSHHVASTHPKTVPTPWVRTGQ